MNRTEKKAKERITSESFNGHSYSMINLITQSSVTGDPEIDRWIAMYTAPLGIGGA